MGIKDRLREMDQQESLRWRASYEDRERYGRLQTQYENEFPKIRASQTQMLEKLRLTGLIYQLEEVLGEAIPPLPQFDREEKQRRKLKEWTPGITLGQSPTSQLENWRYEIPYPSILDNGEWDATLRIVLSRREFDISEGEFVTITYSPDNTLSIAGETTTFSRVIPENIGANDAFFEDVLVDAFKNPYIPGKYHPLNLPGFQPPDPQELIV